MSDPVGLLRERLPDAVVALDYDGTLAPIVDRPSDAVPADGAREVLRALAPRVRVLALVTGRPADVVVELAGLPDVPGLVVLGQYGAQRWAGADVTSPAELPGVARLRQDLPALLEGEGAELEDKGISLVVHTRRAADPTGAQERLRAPLEQLAAEAGVEVHLGRLVLELRPPGFDKGGALSALAQDVSAVLFAGDDVGDLPAFAALDRLAADGVTTCKVAISSDELHEDVLAAADVLLDGPHAVLTALEPLA